MKKLVLVPIAAFALAACGDTPTLAPEKAFRDDIPNTLDATVDAVAEAMPLTVGGPNGSTKLYVVPQNGDGKNGCNLTGSTTLVVSVASSNTSVATVSPSSITFGSCGDEHTLTVTPVGPGSASISLGLTSNNTGGTFNLAPATFTVTVAEPTPPADVTPPAISYVLDPASPDGSNGWYRSSVTLTWTVTENESASSLVKTGCVDQSVTADQAETTYSCSATSDGGSAGPVDVSIRRDGTAPTVGLVGGPAAGGSYYFGSVPAAPACSASDATSGLAGPCTVSGYGTAVGPQTVTATATDVAGNQGAASAGYTVLAWVLNGFYAPVNAGALNTAKAGSTIPLKFEVFAAEELTSTSVVTSFRVQSFICSTSAFEDPVEITTTGGTSLRYDSAAGQFVQNWQTPKATGCYRVTVGTQDGSSISADFKLK